MFYHPSLVKPYLLALKKEIQSYQIEVPLKTIYIGGGTPSCLTLEETEELLSLIDFLPKDKGLEYTIECNIENLTEEKLKLYHQYGVNRLSIGVQTVEEKFMPFLGRYHTKDEVINCVELAHKIGFSNINLDLMYGFFDQTVEDVVRDLDFFVSLDITHISTYSLMIEEHTKLYLNKTRVIDDEVDSKMYEVIRSYLKNKQFSQYEISNFSKKGFRSRHNLVYWNNEHYYGFGLGASGYIGKVRYTNTRSMNDYLKGKWLLETEELTRQDVMIYEMILGLRKIEGISKKVFQKKFQCKVEDVFSYQDKIDNKLLIEEENRLRIPEDKLYLSNEVLVSFVGVELDEEN